MWLWQEALKGCRRKMTLSPDLRDRVLGAAGTAEAVAGRFEVSVSYVKARAQLRDTGEMTPRLQRDRLASRLSEHEEALPAEVARRPSATSDDLRLCAAAPGVSLRHTAMWNALAGLALTLKKSRSGQRGRTART